MGRADGTELVESAWRSEGYRAFQELAHKHLFLPTLGPGRHLPEGHGEDGKKMKPVKLLSDLSAV